MTTRWIEAVGQTTDLPKWVMLTDKISGASGKWFDATRRIDGGGFVLPTRPGTTEYAPDAFPYVGTPTVLGRACLDLFGDPAGTTFVDIGAGKGRMVVLAAETGFAECVGVEFDEALSEISRDNLARRGHTNGDIVTCDAREFVFPNAPLALYFNNPFGAEILETVIRNLADSYERSPRPISIILQRRVIEDPANDSDTPGVLARAPFLHGGPVAPVRRRDRVILKGWAIWRYATAEALGAGSDVG